ncbi:hypothetical protein CLOP_g22993 [Closterium sp. NIES-67]|nr:hypothetical protein CLOP_g22993 [Closterium sp. NIES-67]
MATCSPSPHTSCPTASTASDRSDSAVAMAALGWPSTPSHTTVAPMPSQWARADAARIRDREGDRVMTQAETGETR